MDDLTLKIEKLTRELDRCYQEGVIFYPSVAKTIEIIINNLQTILKNLRKVKN